MINLGLDRLPIVENNKSVQMPRSSEDKEKIWEFRVAFETAIRDEGWNKAKVCRALGRSNAWLSKILSGARGMDVLDLMKIAEALKIPPSRLLPNSPFNNKNEDEKILKKLRDVLTTEQFNKLLEMGPKK